MGILLTPASKRVVMIRFSLFDIRRLVKPDFLFAGHRLKVIIKSE